MRPPSVCILAPLALAPSCAGPDRAEPGEAIDCRDPTSCEYRGLELEVLEMPGGTFVDPQTGREIPVHVRYPRGPGPYPVVIWSHGGALDADGHHLGKPWSDAIASNGYVVVHLAHVPIDDLADAAALCAVAAVPAAECVTGTDPSDPEAPFVTIARPRDVIALLDALPDLGAAFVDAGGPQGDLTRVVIAGWSAGSRAPLVLLGAARHLTPSIPAFTMPDPRPIAGLALSPAGPGFLGFYAEGSETSWDGTRGPVLVATGDNDVKPDLPDMVGAIRRQAHDLAPADGTRRLLYSNLPPGVGGHDTYNLGDLESEDEQLAGISRALRSSVLAWLDAVVHDDPDARAWLDSDRAVGLAGDADWETR